MDESVILVPWTFLSYFTLIFLLILIYPFMKASYDFLTSVFTFRAVVSSLFVVLIAHPFVVGLAFVFLQVLMVFACL